MEDPTDKCRKLRYALAPYIEKYVLGTGWITDWKDIGKHRRYYISLPTIKVADKNLLFKDQQLISKEHHINVFISNELISQSKWKLKMYDDITFGGVIRKYTRKDGTYDWGVYPLPQSRLEYKLTEMRKYMHSVLVEEGRYSQQMLLFLERYAKAGLIDIESELENAGNLLPTFNGTYQSYKKEVAEWNDGVDYIIRKIRTACSNRKMRRRYKIPYNFAQETPSYA